MNEFCMVTGDKINILKSIVFLCTLAMNTQAPTFTNTIPYLTITQKYVKYLYTEKHKMLMRK